MKSTIILLAILVTNTLIAQINYKNDETGTYQTGSIDSPFLRVSKSTGNKIVGSIYLNEDWEQATIKVNTNTTVKSMARFNAYHSEIELLIDNKVSALLPAEGIAVVLNNRVFTPIKLPHKTKPIFAERLVYGHNSLYKVYDVKINKAPSDAKLLNLESNDMVSIISDHYFIVNDKIQKMPTNKKEFKTKLPVEVTELAKKEKLSIKKEQDIIKLFELTNTLN